MAPLELTCRGGDPRALKGFIAAALGGVDAKFAPMTKATAGPRRKPGVARVPPTQRRQRHRPLPRRRRDPPPPPAPSDGPPSDGPSGKPSSSPPRSPSRARPRTPPISPPSSPRPSTSASPRTANPSRALQPRPSPTSPSTPRSTPSSAKAAREASRTRHVASPRLPSGRALRRASRRDARVRGWRRDGESVGRRPAVSACAADGAALVLDRLAKQPPKDPSGKFCITTAINYANGNPHMGHAYEAVSTDVIARYHRAYGREVLFQTGSDEHGQKIAEAAETDPGCAPIELCDKYVAAFQDSRRAREDLRTTCTTARRATRTSAACAALRAVQGERGHLPGHVRGVVQRARGDVRDGDGRGGGRLQGPGKREAAEEDEGGIELFLPAEPIPGATGEAHRGQPGVHPARASTQRDPRQAPRG